MKKGLLIGGIAISGLLVGYMIYRIVKKKDNPTEGNKEIEDLIKKIDNAPK